MNYTLGIAIFILDTNLSIISFFFIYSGVKFKYYYNKIALLFIAFIEVFVS